MRRVLILFGALFAVSVAAFSEQPAFGPRDPGAARQNLSNVDAATGRSALGLGTMAAEASTDYVATDTFTGHTGDTGNPHSVSAAQAGALPLSGYNPMIGDLQYNVDSWGIHHAASDTAYVYFSGGSNAGSAYGSYFELFGNQHAINAGKMIFQAGNVASGAMEFYTSALGMTIQRDGVVNFPATFTINGEDVLGDISTALDGILGS